MWQLMDIYNAKLAPTERFWGATKTLINTFFWDHVQKLGLGKRLDSLIRKNIPNPLNRDLNALFFALKDSADAFVLRLSK
jgi:hypothetical protein